MTDSLASTNPLVSIVVTTRNEASNIGNCLESIGLQTYSPIELIVVDNSSHDATKEIARRYTPNVYDFGPERSAQRNFGLLNQAHGRYFAYIDADMVLGPEVVSCAVAALETGSIGVYVPEVVLGCRLLSRARRFEREFYDGTVVDAVRFFRSDAFREVGGFDAELFHRGSGEDWDLDNSLRELGDFTSWDRDGTALSPEMWPLTDWCQGHGVNRPTANAIYHNESEIRLFDYLKKKSYYATGFEGYISKWGVDHPAVRLQFSSKYRLFTVFVTNSGWRKLAVHPILTATMFWMRFAVGISYLRSRRKHA